MHIDLYARGRFSVVADVLLAFGCATASQLNAQCSDAGGTGTVVDYSSDVIPKASIQVKNVATGQVQQAPSDTQGRYTIPNLAVGNYEAQASAPGFQTVVRPGVTLTVGSQIVVDFTLPVGQSQQAVTVESQV